MKNSKQNAFGKIIFGEYKPSLYNFVQMCCHIFDYQEFSWFPQVFGLTDLCYNNLYLSYMLHYFIKIFEAVFGSNVINHICNSGASMDLLIYFHCNGNHCCVNLEIFVSKNFVEIIFDASNFCHLKN